MLKRRVEKDAVAKLYVTAVSQWNSTIALIKIYAKLMQSTGTVKKITSKFFKKSSMKGFTYYFYFKVALMWTFGCWTK